MTSGAAATPARRLRQRPERHYYEGNRRAAPVATLQLSPRKIAERTGDAKSLMSSVQSYFRAGRSLKVLARRQPPSAPPQYLILWEPAP